MTTKYRQVLVWAAIRAVIGPLLLAATCAWGDQPLTVVTDVGYPPYQELNAKGEPTGFSVDLLNAIAQAEDIELQWRIETWEESLKGLSAGRIDIMPMMAQSAEREDLFDFSDPIVTSDDAIFVRRGEQRVNGLQDLKQSTILVVRDGLAHQYLARSGRFHGLVLATSTDEAMQRLANGEADCLLTARLTGLLLVRQLGLDNIERLPVNVPWYNRISSIAVKDGNAELLATLNRGLKTVRYNGTYDRLFEQWIASADQSMIKQRKNLQLLYLILGVALLCMLVAAAFLLTLRRIVADRTQALRDEIEERQKADNAALLHEQKFASAFKSTMQGMYIATLDRTLTDVNQSLCHMLGYSEQELLGTDLRSLLHPEDIALFDKRRALMSAGELNQYQCEVRLRKKNGSFIWVQVFSALVYDAEGRPYEVVSQLLDVTQSKADQRKLAQQLYDLKFLRDTLDDHAIVARVDRYGVVSDINVKGCQISGYNWGDLLGQPVERVLVSDSKRSQLLMIRRALKGGEVWQGETVWQLKGEERLFLNTTVASHRSEDGSVDFYLVVCTDITQQKNIEIEQEALKARLQQAAKMESIGRLTGGVAHDFNNILASILGFTDLTLKKYGDDLNEKATRYLREVYSAGERARDLIAQMMAFSRTQVEEPKAISASVIIQEALKMLQPTLPSSIEVKTHIASNQDHSILMDPIKMHQILMNLMINARDAMAGKGQIDVRLRAVDNIRKYCASCHHALSGHYIELSVKDTGRGMALDTQQKIFDPFFTTKDIGEGTGMGLSVVHGIVHEHDGHILVETSEDTGSEFRILFQAASPTETLVEESTTVVELKGRNVHVLVVDDESLVGVFLKELLESVGHRVSLFNDSQQAWQAFEENAAVYDMLITDQTMPRLLGSELIRQVRGIREDIPVVLCTGYADTEVEQSIQGLNVDLLRKPIDSRRLLNLIPN